MGVLSAAAAIQKLLHKQPLPILALVVSFVTLRNRRPTTALCVCIPYAVRGRRRCGHASQFLLGPAHGDRCDLAFTRYAFTSRLLCRNQPSLYCLLPPASPTRLQYYCNTNVQYSTPFRPPICTLYTIQYCALQYRVKAKVR